MTHSPVDALERAQYIKVVRAGDSAPECDGYAAVVAERGATFEFSGPAVLDVESLHLLKDGYIVVVEPHAGMLNVVYRPESCHNSLFATERCDNACVMCSQPPRLVDDSDAAAELVRIVELVEEGPEHLCITGGEPLLLRDGIVRVIETLARRFPNTAVTMLSNGRGYSDEAAVARIAAVCHARLLTSVPLHGDTASDHDFVAQVNGAFDQTVSGLYNAARFGLATEVRVVLHAVTIPVLRGIVDFVYRNLPFVQHVALMGLEDMGYARLNSDILWADPVDYAEELRSAVTYCHYRRVPVSIYNLPLCVLPHELWSFARQSISDHKNIYLDECNGCRVRLHCAGFFSSSRERHSRGIRAVL